MNHDILQLLFMLKWFKSIVKKYFLLYFPYVVVFTGSLFNPSDSDLGWHLKYGEYFFKTGQILRENIYSTMMPGYHWVNSSWATDLITYATFSRFGFMGLSVLGALTVTAIFFFFSKAAKLTFFEQAVLFPLLLFYEEPLTAVSFRGQLLSLLFIGILYYLLSKYEQGKITLLFLAVPVFCLWSNLHGQFILGLGLFLGWIILYLVAHRFPRKEVQFLFLIFTSSALASLINPFGFGIYQEALRHFGNPWQQFIIEWLPFDRFSNLWWRLIFWDILVFFSLGVLYWKKQLTSNLPYFGLTVFLIILSFWMRRYTWPMLLVSIPLVKVSIQLFTPKWKSVAFTLASIMFIFFYGFFIFIQNPKISIQTMSWERYCKESAYCSPKSAEFIIKNKLTDNLLTFYNWGGWLIWNYYPQIKPSIDGRMHLWEEHGYSAFAEYYPIEQNFIDVDLSRYDVVYITPKKPLFKRMAQLIKEGTWDTVYFDDFAAVFIRKQKATQKLAL